MEDLQAVSTDKHLSRQDWMGEERHYKEILVSIERLRSTNKNDVALLMKWVSCMHRLSAIYEGQSDQDKTYYYLITPHNWVVDRLHDKTLSEDDVAITKNLLGITFEPLYKYIMKKACCSDCMKNLEQQRAWLEQTTQHH